MPSESNYFVFDGGDSPRRWVDDEPYDLAPMFRQGHVIADKLETPLLFSLKPWVRDSSDHGPYLASYMRNSIPLFRDDLIAALKEAGVREFDAYEAIVKDPEQPKQPHTNYKAVNIIGLIGAADMARSVFTTHSGGPVGDVDFDELVLDDSKARGRLMFRLAESTNIIMVHRRVRDHLLARGFDDLEFYEPEEVAT